jgi:replicative DNA helicase
VTGAEVRSDRTAEQAVLAACLMSKTARQEARRTLTGRDFDDPRHEEVWDALSTLDRHGKAVEATTVLASLGQSSAAALMPDLVTAFAVPDSVGDYAAIVRGWSVKRQIESLARATLSEVMRPTLNGVGYAATVAGKFAAVRDSHITDDITGLTVSELLSEADDEPDWLIPGLLERRDRLMLTGEEGLGKSHTLRQIALHAAGGIHPFEMSKMEPIKATIIDCENTWAQVRRKVRPAVEWVSRYGQDPSERVVVDCSTRMDITRDRDLSRIHQLLDAQQPDLVVIGPLYRLVPRALQTDDEAAPVLAALDTIRDRGCAVLIEAHAGHAIGKGGVRDLRPRGSSALLGWPEFGYGMRTVAQGYCDLVPWRGNREERAWPQRMRRADGFRWIPHHDLYGWNEGGESA